MICLRSDTVITTFNTQIANLHSMKHPQMEAKLHARGLGGTGGTGSARSARSTRGLGGTRSAGSSGGTGSATSSRCTCTCVFKTTLSLHRGHILIGEGGLALGALLQNRVAHDGHFEPAMRAMDVDFDTSRPKTHRITP